MHDPSLGYPNQVIHQLPLSRDLRACHAGQLTEALLNLQEIGLALSLQLSSDLRDPQCQFSLMSLLILGNECPHAPQHTIILIG